MNRIRKIETEAYHEIERVSLRSFVSMAPDQLHNLATEFEAVSGALQKHLENNKFSSDQIEVGDVWNGCKAIGSGVYVSTHTVQEILDLLQPFEAKYPEWAMTIFFDAEDFPEIDGLLYKGEFLTASELEPA